MCLIGEQSKSVVEIRTKIQVFIDIWVFFTFLEVKCFFGTLQQGSTVDIPHEINSGFES